MAKQDSESELRSDPMGVRARWGRRELIFLVVAVLALALVAWLASRGIIGGVPRGKPVGDIPQTQNAATQRAP